MTVLSSMPSAAALRAAYNFDEGSGLLVVDLTNNGHRGALYGAAPVWVAGQAGHGSALSTNGGASGGGVSIGPVDSFDAVVSGTIEAWVKYGGASGFHMWWDTRPGGCGLGCELGQGSGWGALAWEPLGKRLVVEQVYDHQGNIGNGTVPLLVLDMWEHAYYLQYQIAKGDWVKAFWQIVNWPDAARRFEGVRTLDLLL
jgi:hypothetical protein